MIQLEKFTHDLGTGTPRNLYELHTNNGERIGTYERIEESQSLSKVWSHEQERGFAILSAYRFSRTEEKNMELHRELGKKLLSMKLGYWEVDGVYQDEEHWLGSEEEGNLRANPDGPFSDELSLFIPYSNKFAGSFDEFEKTLIKLAFSEPYDQDTVLIAPPKKSSENIYSIHRVKGKQRIGTRVGFDKIGQIFTRLRRGSRDADGKRKAFIVESIGIRKPGSHMERYSLKSEGIFF